MRTDRPTLLIFGSPPGFWLEKVTEIRDWVHLEVASTPKEAEEKIADAEIVFIWEEGRALLRRCWSHARRLRWIQSCSAGLDGLLFPELIASSVQLTNARGLYAPPLAEFVIFCALFFAKRFHRMEDNRRNRRWQRYQPDELKGRVMGIVGLGGTGEVTARLAKAFGMRVLATKRNLSDGRSYECVDDLMPLNRWRELLQASDYVVNALPLTGETRGVFGEPEFRAMKTSACFINVGRGPTVQEAVLVRALQEGWIACAGLDVFEKEPLPAESELYALPNVIVSPHSADLTATYYDESARILRENVRRYLSGQPLEKLVDKQRGY